MSVEGTLLSFQLSLFFCGNASQGFMQSWGRGQHHCRSLGAGQDMITCLSAFPCRVYSTEGHIGPEPHT